MNWINTLVRPRFSSLLSKREVPQNLWIKCPETGEMIFHRDLEANGYVVPGSGYHMRMPLKDRIAATLDPDGQEALELPAAPADPLKFRDEKRYADRLKDARTRSGREDAVAVLQGTIRGVGAVVAFQDFSFMGGSLGMAAGEAIIAGADRAREKRLPYVLVVASGGARMQEGILSLMQMPRTIAAIAALKEAGLPYVVVLTNPTTGGVTASYAMLGDIHLAEPGALIGFAGPRVIEQTIREKLPAGFQRAEYLLEHGMVDAVVHRHEMAATLARILSTLLHRDGTADPGARAGRPGQAATPRRAATAEPEIGALPMSGEEARADGAAGSVGDADPAQPRRRGPDCPRAAA